MPNRLGVSLFLLRASVFVVMILWSIQKLVAPEAAAGIFESFYYIGGLTAPLLYTIAVAQMVVEVAFVLGVLRFWTYGFVLVTHAFSTLSSWQQYLQPLDNMLFLAAVPMLAACVALFLLREQDNFLSLGPRSG